MIIKMLSFKIKQIRFKGFIFLRSKNKYKQNKIKCTYISKTKNLKNNKIIYMYI